MTLPRHTSGYPSAAPVSLPGLRIDTGVCSVNYILGEYNMFLLALNLFYFVGRGNSKQTKIVLLFQRGYLNN